MKIARGDAPENMSKERRMREWLCRLGLILASAALALAAVEGAVRIRQRIRYGTADISVAQYRFDRATRLRIPVSSGRIQINSLGFRGPELDMPKPPGRVRIAFLGSSTTFCAEVSDNFHTWPHLVTEAIRRAYPWADVDYVNAGVPGYTVLATQRNLDLRVKPLQPDIIVIYEGHNDISFDTRDLARAQGLDLGREDAASELGRFSGTWFLIEKNLDVLGAERRARNQDHQLVFDPHQLSRAFEQRLRDFVKDAQQTGSLVAIAPLVNRIRASDPLDGQVRSAASLLYFMPYMSIRGVLAAYEEYNRVIRATAAQEGLILLEGDDSIPQDSAHFHDAIHFSDAGARAMAESVFAGLNADPRFRRTLQNAVKARH
jgi:lysophospholipase L1-like esterase